MHTFFLPVVQRVVGLEQLPALEQGAELHQATFHTDRPGRPGVAVAFPAPQAPDDPRGPRERLRGKWVVLFDGVPLQAWAQLH